MEECKYQTKCRLHFMFHEHGGQGVADLRGLIDALTEIRWFRSIRCVVWKQKERNWLSRVRI
jgi:hypothetical protein